MAPTTPTYSDFEITQVYTIVQIRYSCYSDYNYTSTVKESVKEKLIRQARAFVQYYKTVPLVQRRPKLLKISPKHKFKTIHNNLLI